MYICIYYVYAQHKIHVARYMCNFVCLHTGLGVSGRVAVGAHLCHVRVAVHHWEERFCFKGL